MLDIKKIRENPEEVKKQISRRDSKFVAMIDEILAIDGELRKAIQEQEILQAKRNELSKLVGQKKGKGEDAEAELKELATVKESLKKIADNEPVLNEKRNSILEGIPNLPVADIPDGADENDNQEILKWGEPKDFGFKVKEHDDIGRDLDILDFERGVKIAESRFTLVKGLGAKLERALINFFLDTADKNGYTEVFPPILVNSQSLYGTSQLPKFREDLYKIEGADLFLIPTAEVPVTNIHRDEILAAEELPKHFCAYTPNFRSEAGAASKDTRGIIRQHQFNKVELVKICKPEDSEAEHEKLTADAESILQALKLPYRKSLLCTGDMGFGAQKCYDLEVWFPGQNKYREISSCSNFGDFQARRAKLRFKRDTKSKAELLHTLNGSGLAVGRTFASILENYQNEDGSVTIPEVLVPYMNGVTKIEPFLD